MHPLKLHRISANLNLYLNFVFKFVFLLLTVKALSKYISMTRTVSLPQKRAINLAMSWQPLLWPQPSLQIRVVQVWCMWNHSPVYFIVDVSNTELPGIRTGRFLRWPACLRPRTLRVRGYLLHSSPESHLCRYFRGEKPWVYITSGVFCLFIVSEDPPVLTLHRTFRNLSTGPGPKTLTIEF